MKRLLFSLAITAFAAIPLSLLAQEENTPKVEVEEKVVIAGKGDKKTMGEKKVTQEIVIRNKGDKELDLKVEIKGDVITVNGKPLSEFKDDQVTINKRKMIIREGGEGGMTFNYSPKAFSFDSDMLTRQYKGATEISRPFLGVTTEKVAGNEGAKIVEIVKESAAEKAGLKKDDIITKVDNAVIADGESLSEVITSKKARSVVKIAYTRNGKASTANATLGERKMKAPMAMAFSRPGGSVQSFSIPRINGEPMPDGDLHRLEELQALGQARGFNGNQFFDWDHALTRQKRLGLKIQDTEEGGNVKVIEVEEGSAAEKAGLKKDDIITAIGGVKIANTDEAREQLAPSDTKTAYTINAKRNGSDMTFEVKFPKKLKTANL